VPVFGRLHMKTLIRRNKHLALKLCHRRVKDAVVNIGRVKSQTYSVEVVNVDLRHYLGRRT